MGVDVNSRGGTFNIMLIETADAGINWTEPKDMDVDAFTDADKPITCVKPSSKHMCSNGFFYHDTTAAVNSLMMDGGVQSLSPRCLTGKRFKALLQSDWSKDNEIDRIDWSVDDQELLIHWQNVAALAVWFVSVGLLLYRAVRSRKAPPQRTKETAG